MLELTHLNKSYFNRQYLKFRTQYYFNETKELIARHKLLTAFIICLLAPGVKNIQAIGIPFYALIDPSLTFKTKSICLISILFFLFGMTKAQLSFIRGGTFREYLHTFYIPASVHKAVDFIMLLLSLNIVWLAIFFGGTNILHNAENPIFISSQYCLYVSTVLLLLTMMLSFLYKKMTYGILVFLALILVVFISKQDNCLLNFGVGISISFLCGCIVWTAQPYPRAQKYSFKIPKLDGNHLGYLKNIFIIQIAVFRKDKFSFFIRFIFCFALSLLILQVLNSREIMSNRQGLSLVLMGLQSYIISTLFTFFEQGKLEHALFHSIFPYQKHTQPLKEIIFIWTGLMLALVPVFFNLKNHCSLVLITFALNGIVLVINRILYAKSLRFCLFSSLLITMLGCVAQYFFLGAYYG